MRSVSCRFISKGPAGADPTDDPKEVRASQNQPPVSSLVCIASRTLQIVILQ